MYLFTSYNCSRWFFLLPVPGKLLMLNWELFHYDSQFSTLLPQMSMVIFEHYMCKRNVERAIQHYKIYKHFQSGT